MPIFNYANYVDEGSGWSSYFGEWGGCENAAVDVDTSNGDFYAVFDYFNVTDNDWDLLVMQGNCNDEDADEHPDWEDVVNILGDVENTKYPDISADQGNIIIVTQTDEAGTEDIVCFYSNDAGDTWQQSTVYAKIGDDVLYPAASLYGLFGTCTFIMEGNLYACSTDDGGQTWTEPEMIT
jgi:hypothetical protein